MIAKMTEHPTAIRFIALVATVILLSWILASGDAVCPPGGMESGTGAGCTSDNY